MDHVLIPLHGRSGIVGYAKVDQEDAERIGTRRWNLQLGYAKRTNRRIAMQRDVLSNWDMTLDVDHINGDKLDNRKSNLRLCTQAENCRNNRLIRAQRSGFRGVHHHGGKFRAMVESRIMASYRRGGFATALEAAHAYDRAAAAMFGEFATLNFPCAYRRPAY